MKIFRLFFPLFLLVTSAFSQVNLQQAPGTGYLDNSVPRRNGTGNKMEGTTVLITDANGLTVPGSMAIAGASQSASTGAVFPLGTTSLSSLRIPHGAAPTSPVNGDVWSTTTGLYFRANGITQGPFGAASGTITSGTTNTLPKYTEATTVGDSLLSDDGTTLAYTGAGGISVSSGSTAGAFYLIEGPAASLVANKFGITAPSDVAAGGLLYVTPAAASSGVLQATNSAGVMTLSHSALTSGRVTFATTNGLLSDDSDMTFATDTLTVTKVLPTTIEMANTDTTISRSAAGVIAVEGNIVSTVLPRITAITSSATPTYNTDTCDVVNITALAAAITSMTSSRTGTLGNFQQVEFRIKDDGTARAITWGADFSSGIATLPTTTLLGKTLYVYCEFDSVTGDLMCQATGSYP